MPMTVNDGKMAAIFDMDGTLLDSMSQWRRLVWQYMERNSIPVSPQLGEKLTQMRTGEAVNYLCDHYAVTSDRNALWKELYSYILPSYQTTFVLKPGALNYLKRLREKGVRLCVATATDRAYAEAALARNGVLPLLDFILTEREAGKSKDAPDIYLQAAERLGVIPGDCVVYEDALHAVSTAKRAGFTVWGIADSTEICHRQELQKLCDYFWESYYQMP